MPSNYPKDLTLESLALPKWLEECHTRILPSNTLQHKLLHCSNPQLSSPFYSFPTPPPPYKDFGLPSHLFKPQLSHVPSTAFTTGTHLTEAEPTEADIDEEQLIEAINQINLGVYERMQEITSEWDVGILGRMEEPVTTTDVEEDDEYVSVITNEATFYDLPFGFEDYPSSFTWDPLKDEIQAIYEDQGINGILDILENKSDCDPSPLTQEDLYNRAVTFLLEKSKDAVKV